MRPRVGNVTGSRWWSLAWYGIVVVACVATFDPKLYVNGDNVDYIHLAEAARDGNLWASAKYPPLFPWLLTIPQSIFGAALLPQKILVVVCFLAAAWLLTSIARKMLPAGFAEPAACLAMLIVPVTEYGHYVMSEVPFLLLSIAGLILFRRAVGGDRRYLYVSVLLAAATFYTRSVGLSLWGALGLALLLRGRTRPLFPAFAAASALLILPWVIHAALGARNPYFHQLVQVNPFRPDWGFLDARGWMARIGENARVYLGGEIPTLLLPVRFRWTYDPPELRYAFLPFFVGIVPALLCAVGLIGDLRSREPLGLYVVSYLLLILLWPAIWTGTRFLVPILPFLFLLMMSGILRILGLIGGSMPPRRRLAVAILAVFLALAVRNQITLAGRVRSYPPDWDAYFRAASWVKANTNAGDLIVDRKPAMLQYVTGRRTVSFPRQEDPDAMVDWMASQGVDYVVVAPIPYDDIVRYLIPAIQARAERFAPAFEIEQPYTVILRFLPAPVGPDRGSSR